MENERPHEPVELLSEATLDMHRALLSLKEELEAVDWYQQRAEVCADDALRAVLNHNKNEEIEHAMALLEWIRRTNPVFDMNAHKFLFTAGSITALEVNSTTRPGAPAPAAPSGSLGIGSLKG